MVNLVAFFEKRISKRIVHQKSAHIKIDVLRDTQELSGNPTSCVMSRTHVNQYWFDDVYFLELPRRGKMVLEFESWQAWMAWRNNPSYFYDDKNQNSNDYFQREHHELPFSYLPIVRTKSRSDPFRDPKTIEWQHRCDKNTHFYFDVSHFVFHKT